MSVYPYDPDVLEEVADRLYAALPAMMRVPDGPPAGRGDLRDLIEVLAVPLAVIRQSIEELNADLFIDTADDRIVPYLAQLVGTDLVFPDADSNRRDVRGTVGWRRRKGTPDALEEMGGELTGQLVVLEEGWKRIQLAQDLNLVRAERVVPDIRPAIVAEQSGGPLDALFHAVDFRAISARTGRYNAKQVAHWLYPTITFPLREATPVERSETGSDVRFAMHPLGVRQPLRTRRPTGDREPFVDRIQEEHFAAAPERWFGRDGGFTIRICSLPAAIAGNEPAERVAVAQPAGRDVGRGDVTMTVLAQPTRGWRGPVRIELGLAAVSGGGTGTWHASPGASFARGSVDVDVSGVLATASTGGALPGGTRVPMLRLTGLGTSPTLFFPGATIEIASTAAGATAAAQDSELAREGFLRGVLHVTIPPLDLPGGERLLYLAADGSVFDGAADMPEVASELRLAPAALVATGPGAAWPPLLPQSEPTMLNRLPSAPGRGPAVLHGALPLRRTSGGPADLTPAAHCALTFAVQIEKPGRPGFRPFQRLAWDGVDPRQGTWTALDRNGVAIDPADIAREYHDIVTDPDVDPERTALAVRFECSEAGATLCPGEVAWSADDGRTVLVHLPQLDADPLGDDSRWPTEPPYAHVSEAVRVGEDGSTWASESTAARRSSLGSVAPIAEAAGLRRRRVHGRRLCAWDNEDWSASPPQTLALTARGRLDVDVMHGLFAFSADEPPQQWPRQTAGATPPPPPSVTVDDEEGATMHVGARPAAREPVLDIRLPRPTRLVSRSGTLHPDAPPDFHAIPRYDTLGAALDAIADRWHGLTAHDAGAAVEVVQFEDSATYGPETLVWPRGPTTQAARRAVKLSLTIQAAERERPIVLVDRTGGWTVPASDPRYDSLTLRGVAVGAEGWGGMRLPPSDQVDIQLCTVLFAENLVELSDPGHDVRVDVRRCETAGLLLDGTGILHVEDGIVDARPAVALGAPEGEVELERVSVGGEVHVRRLEASETIFDGRIKVQDRFHGCVRYSRVQSYSTLPRIHRVAWDTPVLLVSRNRRDPAWWRLRAEAQQPLVRGAENGSELGAFGLNRLSERTAAFGRRLVQFTPAGLVTGLIRVD